MTWRRARRSFSFATKPSRRGPLRGRRFPRRTPGSRNGSFGDVGVCGPRGVARRTGPPVPAETGPSAPGPAAGGAGAERPVSPLPAAGEPSSHLSRQRGAPFRGRAARRVGEARLRAARPLHGALPLGVRPLVRRDGRGRLPPSCERDGGRAGEVAEGLRQRVPFGIPRGAVRPPAPRRESVGPLSTRSTRSSPGTSPSSSCVETRRRCGSPRGWPAGSAPGPRGFRTRRWIGF